MPSLDCWAWFEPAKGWKSDSSKFPRIGAISEILCSSLLFFILEGLMLPFLSGTKQLVLNEFSGATFLISKSHYSWRRLPDRCLLMNSSFSFSLIAECNLYGLVSKKKLFCILPSIFLLTLSALLNSDSRLFTVYRSGLKSLNLLPSKSDVRKSCKWLGAQHAFPICYKFISL